MGPFSKPATTNKRITSLVLIASFIASVQVWSQQPQRPLRPSAAQGIPVIPYMEGWYSNDDGTVTVSFGYHNRNKEVVRVPLGPDNRIEPAELGGMQPEEYFPGRHHGVFAVTIPTDRDDETVWWHINSAGQQLKVPGERGSTAYELDRNPRPQGSVQPLLWFEGENPGTGPEGVVSGNVLHAKVGEPITIEVFTDDPSIRDGTDPRFLKPLDTRVSWYKHQGPGHVQFSEHPFNSFTERKGTPVLDLIPTPEVAMDIEGGKGPARVNATFAAPGEYLIRARLDNWKSSDSDGLDQCCWSNAYQRVTVSE